MAVLATQLTGHPVQKPRLKTAYNVWGPHNRCFIDPIFKQRVREGNIPAKQQAALCSALYKELFEELPEEEQKEWTERAENEHREAVESARQCSEVRPVYSSRGSTKVRRILLLHSKFLHSCPIRIIENISQFMQPILDLLADHTGWKISLMAGGA